MTQTNIEQDLAESMRKVEAAKTKRQRKAAIRIKLASVKELK